jgi:hypothetical protein
MKKMARYVNLMYEKITRILNFGNVCCHLFFSQLQPINTKIKTHSATVLPVPLYDSETRSFTFREACRLSVFENKVLLTELQ